MINRIIINEERFDKVSNSVKKLEEALSDFESTKKDLLLLNKYYGNKNWHKDKEAYENCKIERIKAGVLSEDGVYNMLCDLDEIIKDMKRVIKYYERIK